MTERLYIPWTCRRTGLPLGMLLDTRLFKRIKDRSLPREFRLARAGRIKDPSKQDGNGQRDAH